MPAAVVEPPTERTDRFVLPNDAAVCTVARRQYSLQTPTTYATDSIAGVPLHPCDRQRGVVVLGGTRSSCLRPAFQPVMALVYSCRCTRCGPCGRRRDDAPARVVVSFRGDRTTLDAADAPP